MANETKKHRDMYYHAIDRIYDIYKHGKEREDNLERELDLHRDELIRIDCLTKNTEIKCLCSRGIGSINKILGDNERNE